MGTNLFFAVALLLASGVLVVVHRRAWCTVHEQETNPTNREFSRRQYLRRMQASLLIGVVAIAIIGSSWIPGTVASALYWSGILLLVIWIGLLGLADLLGSRVYFERAQAEHHAAHAKLTAELKRLQRREGNGQPDRHPHE